MPADVQFSPPRCPECSRPMRLVSVLCSRVLTNAHLYPPVRTFECAACERDMICQWQPTPLDHGQTTQARG
jgi:spore maturation protein CgeB